MGLSLGGLASFAGNAITPLTNVVAANKQADANANQQKIQLALQQYARNRQERDDALKEAIGASTITKNTASADALNNGVVYRPDVNNELVALPKNLRPLPSAPTAAPAPVPSTAQPAVNPVSAGPSENDGGRSGDAGLNGMPAPTDTLPPPPVPKQSSTTIGTPTGVKAPPRAAPKLDPNDPTVAGNKTAAILAVRAANPGAAPPTKIDPNSAEGITADSTKAAYRAAMQRPGGMTGGMGSGGIGGLARTSAAITEMGQAHDMMTPFEEAKRAHQINYDGLDYFLGLRGKMYDAHGVVDQATHAAAFAHLNQVNPRLANYLRAGEMWALADGSVSGRTSDFRTKLDGFVSTIGPNGGDQQIDNTQRGRSTRLEELRKFQPAMEAAAQRFVTPAATGGRGGSTAAIQKQANDPGGNINIGAPSALRQKYDAAVAHLKAQGKTDAQVAAVLGNPPGAE